MREEKLTEFINLHQGGKSVHEYSMEFIKLSKYAPSLSSDPRDQMSRFVMGVSSSEKVELVTYQLKDLAKICMCNGGIIGR